MSGMRLLPLCHVGWLIAMLALGMVGIILLASVLASLAATRHGKTGGAAS